MRSCRFIEWTAYIGAALVIGSITSSGTQKPGADARLSGGNGTLYLGVFPNKILMIDEATEKVSGEIPVKNGIPRRMSLSQDRTRFYVLDASMEQIEIIDIKSRQTLDTFTLSKPPQKVRIRGFEADPLHRFMVLVTRAATKHADRFEIGPSTLLQYDLKEHKVIRTIPWPKGEERDAAQIVFSPDGKYLYFFSEDVLIYETSEFKQVDKWELSQPIEVGFGRIELGSTDWVNEEPGYFTGIFNYQDPVQNRRVMGIARVNLQQKAVDFFTLGPSTPVSFALAPDRKRAYGLMQQIGRYEFWTFDLENRRLHNRMEFPGRPRMGLRTSSNGKMLYIHVAGNTVDLYDAATYKYLRTITLDGDMTTELYVMPNRTTTAASAGR